MKKPATHSSRNQQFSRRGTGAFGLGRNGCAQVRAGKHGSGAPRTGVNGGHVLNGLTNPEKAPSRRQTAQRPCWRRAYDANPRDKYAKRQRQANEIKRLKHLSHPRLLLALGGKLGHEQLRVIHLDLRGDAPLKPVADALNAPALVETKQIGNLGGAAKGVNQRLIFGEGVLFHAGITHHVESEVNTMCSTFC